LLPIIRGSRGNEPRGRAQASTTMRRWFPDARLKCSAIMVCGPVFMTRRAVGGNEICERGVCEMYGFEVPCISTSSSLGERWTHFSKSTGTKELRKRIWVRLLVMILGQPGHYPTVEPGGSGSLAQTTGEIGMVVCGTAGRH
jgi:hypothetical protein